jgi:hypothetical protein
MINFLNGMIRTIRDAQPDTPLGGYPGYVEYVATLSLIIVELKVFVCFPARCSRNQNGRRSFMGRITLG